MVYWYHVFVLRHLHPVPSLHKQSLLDLDSLDTSRLDNLLSFTTRLGTKGDGPRFPGGILKLLFHGTSAHAHIDFSITVCRLKKRILSLRTKMARMNQNRPADSATQILSHCLSIITVHAFSRTRVRRFTSCTGVPMVGTLASLRRPYRVLTSLLAVRRRFNDLGKVALACLNSNGGITRSLLLNYTVTKVGIRVTSPRNCAPSPTVITRTRALDARNTGI